MSTADQLNKFRKERFFRTCKHFTRLDGKVCKAGVQYLVILNLNGIKKRLGSSPPCLNNNECSTPCSKFVAKDIGDWELAEMARREWQGKYDKVFEVIKNWRAEPEVPKSKEMPCPVCETGTLYLTQHYNRHVHGTCSTVDCVRWME